MSDPKNLAAGSATYVVGSALEDAMRENVRLQERIADLEEQLSIATSVTEYGPCVYCGVETDSLAGSPSVWPIVFCEPGANGKPTAHCTKCVSERCAGEADSQSAVEKDQ